MNGFRCLLKKELASCFLSPIAYVMMFCFLVLTGLSFWKLAAMLADGDSLITARQWFFGSPILWFSMPVIVPLLTMRSFAEEKRSGTLETLMTAPVTETAVVLAKFFGALLFFAVMWLPAGAYLYMLHRLDPAGLLLDPGVILSGAFGMLLISAAYIALGILLSALSPSQIVAAIFTFAIISVSFFTTIYAAFATQNPVLRGTGEFFCSYTHILDFSRGVIDSRPVVLYVTVCALLLFTATRVLQLRK